MKIELKTHYTGGLPTVYKVTEDGTYFHRDTPDGIIELLELARRLNYYVWFRLGDRNTGRDWLDDNDTAGFVSRSMGPVKIPILLAARNSSGGGGILCDSIIKLVVHGGGRNRVWQSTAYERPELVIFQVAAERSPWRVRVSSDPADRYQSGFRTEAKARRWVDFITGRRLNK